MAEFYPIAEIKTDKEGKASLKPVMATSWFARSAAANGVKSCSRPRTANISNLCLIHPNSRQDRGFRYGSSAGGRRRCRVGAEEKIQAHNRRLEEGTKVRTEYEGTFLSEEEAFTLAQSSGLPPERVWDVLQKPGATAGKSPRSWRSVPANMASGHCGAGVVERKDLIDTFRQTLDDHLMGALAQRAEWDEDTFVKYILCPRVSYEMLVPYRRVFGDAFRRRGIQEGSFCACRAFGEGAYADDLPNLKGKGNPAGTYSLMKGDEQSLDILFVAVCRSLGIPARLHPSEQKPQYLCAEGWKDAIFRLNSPRNRESSSWGCCAPQGPERLAGHAGRILCRELFLRPPGRRCVQNTGVSLWRHRCLR